MRGAPTGVTMFKKTTFILSIATLPFCVNAQTALEQQLISGGIVGTASVEFSEISVAGESQGCSLVYKTVFPDIVYRKGQLNVAVGNITFMGANAKSIGFSLKVGVRPFLDSTAPFERPSFAYISTSQGSSAKVKQVAVDGDEGFKMFVYSFTDPKFMKVLEGILDDDVITVGFNRQPNSMDQKFEVDFRVEDVVAEGVKFKRKQSANSKKRYIECVLPLLEKVISEMED